MKRISFIILLFSLTVLPGCSYMTQFVVVNSAANTVELTCFFRAAEYKQLKAKQIHLGFAKPRSFMAKYKFQSVSHADIIFDDQQRSARVKLPGKSALRAFTILNYTGHDSFKAREFGLEQLHWSGATTGEVKGRMNVLRKFEQKATARYEFVLPEK